MNLSDARFFSRMAACDGKERFLTRALAERVATRVGRRHKGMRANAYQCRGCGGFHIGSTIGKAA